MIMSNGQHFVQDRNCSELHDDVDEALPVIEEALATFTRALGIDKMENPKVVGEMTLKYFREIADAKRETGDMRPMMRGMADSLKEAD
jgi:hypothetical protein